MGRVSEFEREKLFCGILYNDTAMLDSAVASLAAHYGTIDYVSPEFVFSELSSYYEDELPGTVYRRFVSFEKLILPDMIAKVKQQTNEIEQKLSCGGSRRVNLDPGLIGRGALLLPTTKYAPHRIAMHDGIYVELTLFYCGGDYDDFPWTYRDFKCREVKDTMLAIRKNYIKARRSGRAAANVTE